VRRIPGKFLGDRVPASAILAHREHGIEPYRDPGPFLFENREHIITRNASFTVSEQQFLELRDVNVAIQGGRFVSHSDGTATS